MTVPARLLIAAVSAAALLCGCGMQDARAQEAAGKGVTPADLVPVRSIAENSISNLHAQGDTLWVGAALDVTADGGQTWNRADVDSLDGPPRVFSLDVEGSVVWAGLGTSAETAADDQPPTAAGFVFSRDAGETWTYREPPLDEQVDTTVTYGGSVLPALPVVVPQQSPPYDIDYHPATGTVWTAGWASGLRRSADGGETWERIVLPPDTLDTLHPDSSYSFSVGPERTRGEEANNHLGFSVLVDETGTVWAGTAAGLNRSSNGAFYSPDSLIWRRFTYDGTAQNVVSNWVISIEEQPVSDERNPVWIASWPTDVPGEQYGLTVTRDGGQTFETVLIGEKVNDIAFRGDTVYAAGDRGLFISTDDGATWRIKRDFRVGADSDRAVRPDVNVFAVATTPDAVWLGTNDGLLKSTDGGDRWTVFRTSVPTRPETPDDRQPRVDVYAYPNPYSPAKDRYVRIRYDLSTSSHIRIRIFDYGMNLVTTVTDERKSAGSREQIWDGTDSSGHRVANGTYLYAVETEEDTYWGKILVMQ